MCTNLCSTTLQGGRPGSRPGHDQVQVDRQVTADFRSSSQTQRASLGAYQAQAADAHIHIRTHAHTHTHTRPNVVPSALVKQQSAAFGLDVVGDWEASHFNWKDSLTIESDGRFARGNGEQGSWHVVEREGRTLLRLEWDRWPTEELELQPTMMTDANGDVACSPRRHVFRGHGTLVSTGLDPRDQACSECMSVCYVFFLSSFGVLTWLRSTPLVRRSSSTRSLPRLPLSRCGPKVCVYLCVYVCMCVYVYVRACVEDVFICVCACVCACMCGRCVYLCMYVYARACVEGVPISVCIFLCVHV